jgi:hypothetical protein
VAILENYGVRVEAGCAHAKEFIDFQLHQLLLGRYDVSQEANTDSYGGRRRNKHALELANTRLEI